MHIASLFVQSAYVSPAANAQPGLFWWQLLVTMLFAFLFPVTSAAVINYLERKVMNPGIEYRGL
jgi:hypothetical protein